MHLIPITTVTDGKKTPTPPNSQACTLQLGGNSSSWIQTGLATWFDQDNVVEGRVAPSLCLSLPSSLLVLLHPCCYAGSKPCGDVAVSLHCHGRPASCHRRTEPSWPQFRRTARLTCSLMRNNKQFLFKAPEFRGGLLQSKYDLTQFSNKTFLSRES